MSNIIGPVVTHLLRAESFPQRSKTPAFQPARPVAFDFVPVRPYLRFINRRAAAAGFHEGAGGARSRPPALFLSRRDLKSLAVRSDSSFLFKKNRPATVTANKTLDHQLCLMRSRRSPQPQKPLALTQIDASLDP